LPLVTSGLGCANLLGDLGWKPGSDLSLFHWTLGFHWAARLHRPGLKNRQGRAACEIRGVSLTPGRRADLGNCHRVAA